MPTSIRNLLKTLAIRVFARLRWLRKDLFVVAIVPPSFRARGAARPLRVSDPNGVLARRGELDRTLSERVKFAGFEPGSVEREIADVKLYRGAPETDSLQNVLYVPGLYCLYDENGVRIDASYLRTGIDPSPDAPLEVPVPKSAPRCSQPVQYAGHLHTRHYGHFITEGISRLWSAAVDPSLPILSVALNEYALRPAFFDIFFEARA